MSVYIRPEKTPGLWFFLSRLHVMERVNWSLAA